MHSMLEIERILIRYGPTVAVDDVSLDVRCEEIVALVGPSGCGKTSLLRAIAGFESHQSGRVRLDGVTVSGGGCWIDPERRQVGMVFQQGALFPHLTVLGNVRYGVEKLPGADARVRDILDLVGLTALAGRYPDQLSGGQRQLVALGRALAPAPKVVLLDEPFANLDAALRRRLREETLSILRHARTTAVLVTHDQEEALSSADRVAVMSAGRILQLETPGELYHRPASDDVARFIGGGQLIACRVRDGRLDCAVGLLETDAPDGEGSLLVRPESLEMLPSSSGSEIAGRVIRRHFFGHDSLWEVELPGGSSVHVRVLGSEPQATGKSVRVGLRPGRFQLFLPGGDVHTASTNS